MPSSHIRPEFLFPRNSGETRVPVFLEFFQSAPCALFVKW
ncbi:Hypothetical protein BROD_1318 [Brucella sp. NF 2653]|nr:Hypothetical protein BROD_1318 [Brucella sp. NF 2653]